MPWPEIDDYAGAVQNPRSAFSDPDLRDGHPELTKLGLPRPIAGAFACVFNIRSYHRRWAARCFLSEVSDQQQRYHVIDKHLAASRLPHTVSFNYLSKGIDVKGTKYPLLKMEWVNGESLSAYIERNVRNATALLTLADKWMKMLHSLQAAGIAHGDLQHGNVLVVAGELRLIDYDGMFVPALRGRTSHEIGQKNYQHPRRAGSDFGPQLDNFSAWVVYLSLIALSVHPELWGKYDGGDECLIFRKDDFEDPGSSAVLRDLSNSSNNDIQALAELFISFCALPPLGIPPLGEGVIQQHIQVWTEKNRQRIRWQEQKRKLIITGQIALAGVCCFIVLQLWQVTRARQAEARRREAVAAAAKALSEVRAHTLSRYATSEVARIMNSVAAAAEGKPVDRLPTNAGASIADCAALGGRLLERLNAASNALVRLDAEERGLASNEMEQFAPHEWSEFKKASSLIALEIEINSLAKSAMTAQTLLDHAVETMKSRKARWERLLKARDGVSKSLSDVRNHRLSAYGRAEVDSLARSFSNAVAQLRPIDSVPQLEDEFQNSLNGAQDLYSRLKLADETIARLKVEEGGLEADELKRFAPVEWAEFRKASASLASQVELLSLTRAANSAQASLDRAVAAMRGRESEWAKVNKAMDVARHSLATVAQHPFAVIAQFELGGIERDYSNTVAQLAPTGDIPQQVEALRRTSDEAIALLSRIEGAVGRMELLAQLKDNLSEEATALRQFSPARVKEAENALANVHSATDLSTSTNAVEYAIRAILGAFEDSDAVRRGRL